MNYKVEDWKTVFLDTSYLIRLFSSLRSECKDKDALFVKKLTEYLVGNKASGKIPRQIFVSSITISEIWRKTPITKAKTIINALNTPEVTFVQFDNDIAEFMNETYQSVLSTASLNAFAKANSWMPNDLIMAREWLLKDIMIIASCEYYNCDVLLTNDKNTMIPLADKFNVNSAYAVPECFRHNDTYIFNYLKENVKKSVQVRLEKPVQRKKNKTS